MIPLAAWARDVRRRPAGPRRRRLRPRRPRAGRRLGDRPPGRPRCAGPAGGGDPARPGAEPPPQETRPALNPAGPEPVDSGPPRDRGMLSANPHVPRPVLRAGGDRGGNVRVIWRGRPAPRRVRRRGSGGRWAGPRDRTGRRGGGTLEVARGSCPSRVLALDARRRATEPEPSATPGRASGSGRSSARVGSSSSRASSEVPASSRTVSSTAVSVGSSPPGTPTTHQLSSA